MREAPEQPGQGAGERKPIEVGDGRLATDRRQVAEIHVAEGRRSAIGEAGADGARRIAAHLLGRWRNAGDRPPVGTRHGGRVADDEDLRPARQAEIGADFDPPGAVRRSAQPASGRRCHHPRRPKDTAGRDAPAVRQGDPVGVASCHGRP